MYTCIMCIYRYIYIYIYICNNNMILYHDIHIYRSPARQAGLGPGAGGLPSIIILRPVRLLRVWVSKGLTQADS